MSEKNDKKVLLSLKDVEVKFNVRGRILTAIRGVSLDIYENESIAIVGESGSGKSVTSKAILGILAGNSIVEGGEILYDGKDLLKISEEDMCKIRGDRISMIFQDPLSSLNPIVKIGRQITEAMLLKNKANRRTAKKEFDSVLELLKENMIAALGDGKKAEIEKTVETFNAFTMEAIKLENSYNNAHSTAEALISDMEDFIFLAGKKQKIDVKGRLGDMVKNLAAVKDIFLTKNYDSALEQIASEIKNAASSYHPAKADAQDDKLVRLIAMPNVIVTSHQAFLTNEALDNIASTTLNNLVRFFNGDPDSTTEVIYQK